MSKRNSSKRKSKPATAEDREVAIQFCKEHDIDSTMIRLDRTGKGNIRIRAGKAEYIISQSGQLLNSGGPVSLVVAARRSNAKLPQYLLDNPVGIPDEAYEVIRDRIESRQALTEEMRQLINRVEVSLSRDKQMVIARYSVVEELGDTISFPERTVERPNSPYEWQDLTDAASEAEFFVRRLGMPSCRLTKQGESAIAQACKEAARAFSRQVGLDAETRKKKNVIRDDRGMKAESAFRAGRVGTPYPHAAASVPSAYQGIWGRRIYAPQSEEDYDASRQGYSLVSCPIGQIVVQYDLLSQTVKLDETDMEAAMAFAERQLHADTFRKILDRFNKEFEGMEVVPSYSGRDSLSIRIEGVAPSETIVSANDCETDTFAIGKAISSAKQSQSKARSRLVRRWKKNHVLGSILHLSIMEFLMANQGSNSARYITVNTIIKEVKGRATTIWGGVEHNEMAQRMREFTAEDIEEAVDALGANDLISLRFDSWKRGDYYNTVPQQVAAREFIRLSHAEAPSGTPIDRMTEMQLLSLLDGDIESRPFEQLAEELPVLLEHPACYFAEPEKFQAYVNALPDTLRDYVRLAYKVATGRTTRKMFRAVIAGMGGEGEE